jgi:foldase protein PrsA
MVRATARADMLVGAWGTRKTHEEMRQSRRIFALRRRRPHARASFTVASCADAVERSHCMKRLIVPAILAIAVTLAVAGTGCAKRAVAKVNGETITEQEFYSKMEDAVGRQVLDRLILEHLIAQKAKEKSITVTDAELTKSLEDLKTRVGPDRWKEYLSMSGQSEASIKEDLKQNLLLSKLIVSDPELKQYYEQNKTRFDEPPQATYRRIIVKTKDEAAKLRQEIVSGKMDFAQAVKEKSDDPMLKERGGEIGPVSEGMGDPNVSKLLFTMKIGDVSEPVESTYPQGSYQLIQVLKRTEGKKFTFDQVRDRVLQAVMATKQAEISQLINDLRSGASVTIFMSRYESLAEQYQKAKEQKPPQIPAAPAPKESAPAQPTPPSGQSQSE